MKEKIKTFLCIVVLVGALPYIITVLFQGKDLGKSQEEFFLTEQMESTEGNNVTPENINIEEYVLGMVANEMPISYETEALKAQAVIARTNLLAAIENSEELPETISREKILKLWEDEGSRRNYQRLTEAVEDTENKVMTYQGKYIYAAFHAVSAGATRNAKTSLGTDTMPWLESVDGTADIPSNDYLTVLFWEKPEFIQRLQTAFPDVVFDHENPLANIVMEGRDEGAYVTWIKIGEKSITGEDFRNALGINSACFYLKEVEGKIRIVTKGLGHGLGMSQYGANEMAKNKGTYLEILSYYFKNVEITD